MNLYKIAFEHYSPKDSKEGIDTYLLANTAEEVYEYMRKEYRIWDDSDDMGPYPVYDNDDNKIGTETLHEKIIRNCGELYDVDIDLSTAYYGATMRGWKLIETPPDIDFSDMIKLGIVKVGCIRKHDDFL